MPIISAFYGIVIRMFYKEHEPAHFHAEHAGRYAKVDFAGNITASEIRCAQRVTASNAGPNCTVNSSKQTGRK